MILKIEELIEDCKKQIKDFADIAVIGLSGGADSTLVAILCTLALGKENVYGVEMPSDSYDFENFTSKSSQLILKLNLVWSFRYELKPIVECFQYHLNLLNKDEDKKLFGNIKARIRMIYLYALCEKISNIRENKKVRVIGTDNYSESFIGYFTKWGDGGVDVNPIEELYKSEVYQLLDYFKDKGIITEECINRTPSAGLWEGQTDEGELGITYGEIEQGIRKVEGEWISHEIQFEKLNKILTMHNDTQHKREIPGHFKLRQYCG